MKQSTEMSERKAVAFIGNMRSAEDVALFTDGDERGPVLQAAAQRRIALNAAGGPELLPSSEASPKRKNPKNWRHWKYHTVRFPEDEREPMYVDKIILGTQKNANGEDEDVTIVHRQQRGMDVPNVTTAVVRSWLDQVETRFKQKRKGGKSGGMVLVGRKVKSREFLILESYDEKKTPDEAALISMERDEDMSEMADVPAGDEESPEGGVADE